MPAFDPVRDAVLNSPLTPSYSLSSATPRPSTPSSPSLSRRATDLAVLLNDDNREPSVGGSSHLSNVGQEDKLSNSLPLKRSNGLSRSNTFHFSPADSPTRSPGLSTSPSRPSSSSSTYQPVATPRTTVSPSMPPPSLPSTIPYNPKHRKTPAGAVLQPMSAAEMEMFKFYQGKGTARLIKRKRDPSSDADSGRPTKKIAGNAGVVADHYNARPEIGVERRQESPIIGLKSFNNWVKSILISRFAHPALAAGIPGAARSRGKVLDMGCGKGGDLAKWSRARVKELVAADIASISIDQARDRWRTMRGHKFDATFAQLDCYTEPLTSAFPEDVLRDPFDVVSMQFCMHYAFESEAKVRRMLMNVSGWLRSGGVFIGTVPNATLLLDYLHAVQPSDAASFGNSVYQIRFEKRDERRLYGDKYWFFLQDAVDDVPEYLVQWDNFLRICEEYNLFSIYTEDFHHVFEEHREHPEFKPLMVRMGVVDSEGESSMDEDQWEACGVYLAFAFQKRE